MQTGTSMWHVEQSVLHSSASALTGGLERPHTGAHTCAAAAAEKTAAENLMPVLPGVQSPKAAVTRPAAKL